MKNCTTAAIYCRYSDKKQDGGHSIEAQQSACLKLAHERGWIVFEIYTDRAKTGRNDQRPEFQRMMFDSMSKPRKFDVLIIHSSDRFARNRFDAMINKRELEKNGVQMVSVTQPNLYRDNPEDIITESVVIGFDEYYSRILSMHTKKGMRTHIEKRYWRGGQPPYGYKLEKALDDPNRPRSRLVIDEFESNNVIKIFNLYKKGLGKKRIVNELRISGIKNRTLHVFSVTQIERILSNPIYCGRVTFGSGNDPVIIEKAHPAIIDAQLFEKIEHLRESKRESPTRFRESDYILTGVLKCVCGSSMVGHSAKSGQYFYYACSDQVKRGNCKEKKVRRDLLESRVIQEIKHVDDIGVVNRGVAASSRIRTEFSRAKLTSVTLVFFRPIIGF
jgi:DNA invertase Pin-like site-specific DNA recombinase